MTEHAARFQAWRFGCGSCVFTGKEPQPRSILSEAHSKYYRKRRNYNTFITTIFNWIVLFGRYMMRTPNSSCWAETVFDDDIAYQPAYSPEKSNSKLLRGYWVDSLCLSFSAEIFLFLCKVKSLRVLSVLCHDFFVGIFTCQEHNAGFMFAKLEQFQEV